MLVLISISLATKNMIEPPSHRNIKKMEAESEFHLKCNALLIVNWTSKFDHLFLSGKLTLIFFKKDS